MLLSTNSPHGGGTFQSVAVVDSR